MRAEIDGREICCEEKVHADAMRCRLDREEGWEVTD